MVKQQLSLTVHVGVLRIHVLVEVGKNGKRVLTMLERAD